MINHNRLQLSSLTVNVAVVLIIITGLDNSPADRLRHFKILEIIIEAQLMIGVITPEPCAFFNRVGDVVLS
jgi:hypothetical protein